MKKTTKQLFQEESAIEKRYGESLKRDLEELMRDDVSDGYKRVLCTATNALQESHAAWEDASRSDWFWRGRSGGFSVGWWLGVVVGFGGCFSWLAFLSKKEGS